MSSILLIKVHFLSSFSYVNFISWYSVNIKTLVKIQLALKGQNLPAFVRRRSIIPCSKTGWWWYSKIPPSASFTTFKKILVYYSDPQISAESRAGNKMNISDWNRHRIIRDRIDNPSKGVWKSSQTIIQLKQVTKYSIHIILASDSHANKVETTLS